MSVTTEIVKLIQRKGLKADLPDLDEGELGFATDTKELFIGSSTGNLKILVNKFVVEERTSDPPSPANGEIWIRTDL